MFSRVELVDMIKKAPQTKDGYYFFPRFKNLLMLPGKIKDNGYFYDRSIFQNKMCFHDEDIKIFLSKRSIKLDFQLIKFIDNKLDELLKGYEYLDINDIISGKNYTLGELIDTTIYITKYKYA